MDIKTTVVDQLPSEVERSARHSICEDVVRQAEAEFPKVVRVESESSVDLTRFYKSMIQYRSRHPEKQIQMRKHGDDIYVWLRREQQTD